MRPSLPLRCHLGTRPKLRTVRPSPLTFFRAILRELGDPFSEKGELKGVQQRVFTQAVACGTRCMLVDEAQRAFDRSGKLVKFELVESIKSCTRRLG